MSGRAREHKCSICVSYNIHCVYSLQAYNSFHALIALLRLFRSQANLSLRYNAATYHASMHSKSTKIAYAGQVRKCVVGSVLVFFQQVVEFACVN